MARFLSVLFIMLTFCLNTTYAHRVHPAEPEFQKGIRLLYGLQGAQKDFKQGYQLLLQASEKKHPIAIYCLACCFLKGEGVEEDHTKARVLYQQSADFGYGPGQFNAGIMAKNGDGGPVDNVRAYYYLCLASLNYRDLENITTDAAYYRDQVAVLLSPEERQQVLQVVGQRDLRAWQKPDTAGCGCPHRQH